MYNRHNQGLFESSRLDQFIESKINAAVGYVKSLQSDTFETNSDEQIIEHVCSKYPIQPLDIREDEKDASFNEVSVDAWNYPNRLLFDHSPKPFPIPGYRVTWSIPVGGTLQLFQMQPNTRLMVTIPGTVTQDKLLLTCELPADSADEQKIQAELNGQLSRVKQMVAYVNGQVAEYNNNLRHQVTSAVAARKQELEKILKIKSSLKVNIEKKQGASPLNRVEIKVHTISPLSSKKDEQGAYISDADYEAILNAIRNMGASMETSRASESRDEESLRDMLLVGLNASMSSGTAGAELFRKKGKTDITIPFENKAAFVAECKLWKGEKYVAEGIRQLLGYLTWRDAKTSLIIFNRHNKDFSELQGKVEGVFTAHPGYIKKIATREGEWRLLFRKPDDDNKFITTHVFLFDVYEGETE